MFSALRLGSTIYILDKSVPSLKIGQVISITQPQNQYGVYGLTLSTVDIKVDIDNLEFKSIPSLLNIATFGNIVLSETKESIANEVESMIRNSKLILESVPVHEKALRQCEVILRDLNPLYAKLKDLEEKINSLETKLGGIESKLDNLCAYLKEK